MLCNADKLFNPKRIDVHYTGIATKTQTNITQYVEANYVGYRNFLWVVGNLKFLRLAFALANCWIAFLKSNFLAGSFSIDS